MIEPSKRLRKAILLNDLSLVKRIVRNNPKTLQNPDFEDHGNTSLHLAAATGSVDVAEFLVEAGHEDTGISRNASWDTPLMLAAERGQIEAGKTLIERFPRCVPWTNKAGMDVLMLSSRHAPSAALLPLILAVPPHLYLGMTTPISTTSPLSATSTSPLSPSSATHAHPLTLAQDIHGNTPLHHASASGSLKALRVLLSFGANPLAQNALAWTPLDYSQTVAAEVYFRNLVAEFERRRVENLQKEREERRRLGGGVRLITGDGEEQQQGVEEGERVTMQQQHQQWSPVESRRAVTPTAARSEGWGAGAGAGAGADALRARAQSGD